MTTQTAEVTKVYQVTYFFTYFHQTCHFVIKFHKILPTNNYLCKKYSFTLISSGDLIRDVINGGSDNKKTQKVLKILEVMDQKLINNRCGVLALVDTPFSNN
jgi:hypothetical protein